MVKIARSFTIDKEVLEQAEEYVRNHPEYRSLSHLVELLLRRFLEKESRRGR